MTGTLYKGRFAPSPTGPVHFGTLVTAVGSYLQARKNEGDWLIRMEDVDITRCVPGADTDILRTLEQFGLEWDGEIIYQSQRNERYQLELNKLISQSLIFPCLCSRKQLSKTESSVYPGTCRNRKLPEPEEHALRVITKDLRIEFTDRVMEKQHQDMSSDCGDFIIRRRDQLFAYQLAVVVDDAEQNITEIVRGADLLSSTPRQIYLQQLLGYKTPEYCHLPLVVDSDGNKISKSKDGAKINIKRKQEQLIAALSFLGQKPPRSLTGSSIDDIWKWAIDHWNTESIPKENSMGFD